MEMDTSGNVLKSSTYNFNDLTILSLAEANADGSTLTGGYVLKNDSAGIYIIKSDTFGLIGCYENPITIFDTSYIDSTTPLSMRELNDTAYIYGFIPTISQVSLVDSTYCISANTISNHISKTSAFIQINPNPFNSSATITVTGKLIAGNAQLKIYNAMGSLVRIEPVSNITSYILYRDALNAGLYFYELRTCVKGLLGTGKFAIE